MEVKTKKTKTVNILNVKKLILNLFFFIPFSIKGISLNYTYLFIILLYNKLDKNRIKLLIIFFIPFFISYINGVFNITDFSYKSLISQSANFLIFLLSFFIISIKYRTSLIEISFVAVLISFFYSLYTILSLFLFSDVHFYCPACVKEDLRKYVPDWPQGFSSFMVFGFFASLFLLKHFKSYKTIRILTFFASIIILIVLLLTYTRAVYFSLFLSILAYSIIKFIVVLKKQRIKKNFVPNFFKVIFLLFTFVIVIKSYLSKSEFIYLKNSIEEFILIRTVEPLQNLLEGNNIEDSSASDRIVVWNRIVDTINTNLLSLFFGTGFKGFSVICNIYNYEICNIANSAHSQYMDILLRTGLIGLSIFTTIFVYILFYFFKIKNYEYFAGFIALLLFGLFHETFRLPYNNFLLVILIKYIIDHNITLKKSKKNNNYVE